MQLSLVLPSVLVLQTLTNEIDVVVPSMSRINNEADIIRLFFWHDMINALNTDVTKTELIVLLNQIKYKDPARKINTTRTWVCFNLSSFKY